MPGVRLTAAAVATAALLLIPTRPAAAAGPLLLAPFALGHIIGAVARLAALPLIASAAASEGQPAASYPPTPAYGGGAAGYYAPPNYYAQPPGYGYYPAPQAYYRPAPSYGRPMPRFYGPPGGYYSARTRYSGSYGAHVSYRSGGFGYRRR